ncbi:hypothetical protein [Mesorhizobium amorphae]|uniref:hypothetical protein n=1 Tax=Mesorhizobium amorphae TaxID=71433 RepID=UPI0017812FA0|nr:hypothetical protein [Mesorhizobium amorphae]
MNVSEALDCLGVKRVVWIDDHFNQTAESLGKMLTQNIETTKACNFPELVEAVNLFAYDEVVALHHTVQALTDAGQARRDEILAQYLAEEDKKEPGAVKELTADEVSKVCDILGVAPEDRWPFEEHEAKLEALCKDGDDRVCYMIDLKASRGNVDDTTGLDVVGALHEMGSKGTAFILTHEATVETEAAKEETFLKLLQKDSVEVPLCVVSKTRFGPNDDGDYDIEEALRIAIKRAGVRKNIHEVLRSARDVVKKSFEEAMRDLTRIAPEQFEKFAVEKAYNEGVSETHVIERAVTARLSQGIRELFASDDRAQAVARNLRRLRGIPLVATKMQPDKRLAAFHEAEVWEDGKFLNASYSQLACGDVFGTMGNNSTWFVLLAAPCDIALRNDGKRGLETATLVAMRPLSPNVKPVESHYKLPFSLKGKRWYCDLRETAPVRLATLDIATLRSDGCVRVDRDQTKPEGLMDGQSAIYDDRTSLWLEYAGFSKALKKKVDGHYDEPLRLVFAAPEGFNAIKEGTVKHSQNERAIVWPLRRTGRIRMPYATALLNSYLGRMSRHAFEIDYIDDNAAVA